MPELPEVEVVKRSLEIAINNVKIKDIKIKNRNLRYKVDKNKIKKLVRLKILDIKRRSKYLLFHFEKNILMLVHLGMTGKFTIIDKKDKRLKTSFYYDLKENDHNHDHVIFFFKNRLKLIYNDIRKFGFIKFDHISKVNENSHLKNLGPEPLGNRFNFGYFKDYLKGRNRIIKDILMDQKFVSGLGNIYVNEVLYYSKVNPSRKIDKIKDLEIKKIIKNTKNVLKKAIRLGGSSIKNFSSVAGKIGSFQQHFNVYGRAGDNCSNLNCRGKIQKIVISGRASFFCPKCQK